MIDSISSAMIDRVIKSDSRICFLGYPDGIDKSPEPFLRIIKFDVLDNKDDERTTLVHDLNQPIFPYDGLPTFDLVVNNGTLEHCFNIGQAFRNAWELVAMNGFLLHIAPVSLLNHGFWNINPIAVAGWCEYNGGKVKELVYAINGQPTQRVSPSEIKTSKSGRGQLPPETVMYCLTRKVKAVPFRWPVQGVYA